MTFDFLRVYLPAIEGHVPDEMVQAMRSFLEFCYIARRDVHDTHSLKALDDALQRFHLHREIFRTSGVRANGFNLPHQHSLIHYVKLICAFGAPNGLCSSITESKHIKAVKEPWRRSSRFEALSQMLLTNQRLDKLAAARVDFADRGMLKGTSDSNPDPPHLPVNEDPLDGDTNNKPDSNKDNEDDDHGDVDGPTMQAHVDLSKISLCRVYAEDIATQVEQPDLPDLIQQFIHNQQHPNHHSNTSVSALPMFYGKITIYPSAVATFHAPSDISGIGGMRREHIRAVKSWRNGPGRYDTIFVNTDPSVEGMQGLDVARVRLFFSFSHDGIEYPCALVHWFSCVSDLPDNHTGMWVVEPDTLDTGENHTAIIHLDTIVRASHLIPVFGLQHISRTLSFTDTLDTFTSFYVNKYVDHHAFEIAF
ncbi:hypothetical protein BYT27DRAFT_7224752 [Phlegmacium glaucopus]|nr:hypothetical protein BYT27DRAFT_7224752 [Phlegmacium glaucopus]